MSEGKPKSFAPSKILVPIDGSDNAKRALKSAIDISQIFNAELLVVTVIPSPNLLVEAPVSLRMIPTGESTYYVQQESYAKHFIDEAVDIAGRNNARNVRSEIARADKSIVEEILHIATRERADLIVIGTRGLGGFKRLLQGSVSSGVVEHAHCNVLVVR